MKKARQFSKLIKKHASYLGFLDCGIAKADFLEKEAPRLETWLQNNYHGQMQYMENHFDKRLDPRLLVEGAKSVISLSYNYYPEQIQEKNSYKVAKYAYGEDYHHVIKSKLFALLEFLREEIGNINGRCFVDSAPVLERAWAERAGLGWNGKHTLLIQKKQGSFFFLAELIIDLELEYDQPFTTDHCGSCTRCIDACPTDAILPNNSIDASKCISYATIELKDNIPLTFKDKMEDWMFGCDICQDVCPWNRFSKPHNQPLFSPKDSMLEMDKRDWQELTEETFKKVFKKSAVKRTKYAGLTRNISFLKEK
ncbi:tRNA epoxyqueuosine(34) reductase QueG [Tenacibaculum sp. SZ-18]|uniref:tRNA epoxyqueuosine(34) reductase QueG n=1 Tax=Tenacibaculum sp. SZ-18 TaxID=754423 RepID=UPI000C2D5D7C|nr:tRNA epoxyqueuosine(34) reductase QueG [Tenacibaculum sp. SZ-18]AUC16424.1 tRNA epoxyqueuosine(34) reductase QueG [Tenacibaculum sp. SZ-18]